LFGLDFFGVDFMGSILGHEGSTPLAAARIRCNLQVDAHGRPKAALRKSPKTNLLKNRRLKTFSS